MTCLIPGAGKGSDKNNDVKTAVRKYSGHAKVNEMATESVTPIEKRKIRASRKSLVQNCVRNVLLFDVSLDRSVDIRCEAHEAYP